jgi:hypothetical protein
MGAWGTALFSDDTASDVREDFKRHIGDGLTPEAATALMVKEWGSALDDPDDGPPFWLALAATQWSLGRLVPEVMNQALRILDSGVDLHRWDSDKKLQAKRRVVLERLREQLISTQPPQKKIAPTFRNSNDWAIGSIRAYKLTNGELCLLRVIGHHTDKGGKSPVAELLDWVGSELPSKEAMRQLPVRRHLYPNGRELSQFMLGATSERERKAARIEDTGVVLEPGQKPGGFTVFLLRHLDKHLATLFGLGHSAK